MKHKDPSNEDTNTVSKHEIELVSPNSQLFKVTSASKFALVGSFLCAIYIISLYYGYQSNNLTLLVILNYLKYVIIVLLGVSLYEYYVTKSGMIIAPLLVALVIVWFAGFDGAYRWDAIQHVARAKFYMDLDLITFFSSPERISFAYAIWGFIYHLFGESEIITNVTNMIIGFAGICGLYLIAKETFGKFEAVLTVIVALTVPTLFLVNKWAYLDMPFMSSVIFSVLFLVKYVNTPKNYLLWLSLAFAFISTGIKTPGIVMFALIFLTVCRYNLLNKISLISLGIGSISGSFLVLIMMNFFTSFTGSGGSEFSIVTPLNFGLDAIPLWLSSLNQEVLMILCSGLLLISVVAFFRPEQSNFFCLAVFLAQLTSIIGLSLFPSKYLYAFPTIPYQNNMFYYVPLGIVAGVTALCLIRQKLSINWFNVKRSWILLSWAGLFILFFMINTRMVGYGVKDIFDVAILDFRYLIPALPALAILLAKGVETILSSNVHSALKKSCFMIISIIIVTNLIMGFNLTFYYASSGDSHLEGYQKAKSLTENGVIYTHWPFYYFPEGNIVDIGKFDWMSANRSQRSIYSNPQDFYPGSAILFDSHFYNQDEIKFINVTTVTSSSPYLDPVFPDISERNADTVSFGKIIHTQYEYGTIISFGKNETAQIHQVTGWSYPEEGFTWTNGHNAVLAIQTKDRNSDLILKFVASPYLGGGAVDQQQVTIKVNGHWIGTWSFDQPGIQEKIAVIPHTILEEDVQHIAFELPDAESPYNLRQSGDPRNLALAVRSMVIECEDRPKNTRD